MNHNVKLRKTIVASAVSSIMMASSLPTFAQTESEATGDNVEFEEIVVTGIRSSLKRSQDIKRDSSGIVDSISAEDIGKFPDTNLAESLQRITGVSINRANGEGQNITVRGFGPEFNHVTLNGRTIPGGGVFGQFGGEGLSSSNGATRAFDFANIASEGISGVDVSKTGRANIATGGIGASVNVKTARPLDTPGFRFSTGIKGVYDSTNETGSDVTPELSTLLSWSDEDGRFGIGLALSQQERDSGSRGVFTIPINVSPTTAAGLASGQIGNFNLAPNANITNAPAPGQLVARPLDSRLTFADRERERTNGLLTLQYAPSDSVTLTADYLYARNELFERRGESTGFFSNNSTITDVIFDDSLVATPLLISETTAVRDHAFQNNVAAQVNEIESLGFNIDWQANDRLSFNFDAHNTTNESTPDGPFGSSSVQVSLALATRVGQTTDFRNGGIPITTVDFDDSATATVTRPIGPNGEGVEVVQPRGNGNGIQDAGDLATQIFRVDFQEQETEIDEFRLGGTYEFENGSRFNFGVENRETRVLTNESRNQQTLGDWGINNPGDIPVNLVEQFEFSFDDFSIPGAFTTAFRTDAEVLLEALVAAYTTDTSLDIVGRTVADNAANPLFCTCIDPDFTTSDDITEESTSLYLEYQFSGEISGRPFNTTIGARYEDTDVTSVTNQRVLNFLAWLDDNDFREEFSDDIQQVSQEASYDNFLPSINFDISLTDDVVARASFSQTLARTSYSNLSSSVSNFNSGGGSTLIGAIPTASVANPGLIPLESDNFDLSLEWYYDDSSYLAGGFFRKDVNNFVGIEQTTQTLFGIRDVTAGPRAQAALAQLNAVGLPVNNATLFALTAFLANGGSVADFTGSETQLQAIGSSLDLIPNGDDPLTQFQVAQPVNNESAVIDGFEFAWQHFFGDSGFGIQANYTIVDGDIGFDVGADPTETQFSLLGLSDSANIVGIYEKGPWQARIAFNWRDDFLNNASRGSSRNPVFVDSFSQIDFNLSYAYSDNLSFFIEGINVTGEDQETFGRSDNLLVSIEDLGERYNFGARFSF